MTTKLDISPRVLNEAKRQCLTTCLRMQTAFQRGQLKSWSDIERIFSIKIEPATLKNNAFNYATFSQFRTIWQNSVEARLIAATSGVDREENKIRVDHEKVTFGNVTLYPEQVGCFKAIRDALFINRSVKAALQDGTMGSGKTYVAAATIADLIFRQGLLKDPRFSLLPHPVMIFTPKGVCEHWKRILDSMGLADLVRTRRIYVFSNGEFTTSVGDRFCTEVEDDITGEAKLVWNPLLCPAYAVLDECHNYIRPGSIRTRKIIAMLKNKPPPKMLFMSATPMEKVNDAYTFTLACDTEFMNMHVNEDNFKYFAGLLDKEPQKPNREAVKRLRKVLAPNIFSLPYIKPKFKAVNMVWVVDFVSESHRKIYDTAHARYIEACKKSGRNTAWGQFEVFIELNNYRKTVEPLRAPHLAARAAENYRKGNLATAIGCAFKETVAETIFILVDKYNVPREHISLVWGGKRQYRTEDLLSREEIDKVLREGGIQALMKDRDLTRRLRLSLKYLQDQHEHDETAEAQAYRHERLKSLGLLGKQSDDKRQVEIDNFQDGTTKICIFTLASGGVGLSFDRDKESLLPREGLFTPVYNGKEFQQVLGRLVRRASLSDANQYITMMKGTVEEYHVAPILDQKLKCIAEITNRNFDIIDLLNNEASVSLPTAIKLRNELEAAVDADKDDTILDDFVNKKISEDEEDEEVIEEAESLGDLLK